MIIVESILKFEPLYLEPVEYLWFGLRGRGAKLDGGAAGVTYVARKCE